MTKIKTIIVDDEPLARTLLRNFLSTELEIEIIAECGDGFEALKTIQETNPDLVFLDIQMPKITGLELLELLEKPPVVIFTTAFDQYAIKAFEMNALDYLMKPFSKDRLLKSLEKAKIIINNNLSKNELVVSYKDTNILVKEKLERIVVKDGHKILLIPCESIFSIEAQDDYVMIYTEKSKHLKQQTMKMLEKALDKDFIRVHRSFFVNIKYILRIENYDKESHRIILQNNTIIPVSKNGYSELKKALDI